MKLIIDMGCHTLEVEVEADVDLDSRFKARCLDTGEMLWINGWLIDEVERLED